MPRVRAYSGVQYGLPRNSWIWAGRGWYWLECRNRLGWRWLSWFERPCWQTETEMRNRLSTVMEVALMKRKAVKTEGSRLQHADPDGLMQTHPQLAEWMTAAAFDGEPGVRTAPSITIFCLAGEWRAALKDREEGLVMWLSAQGPVELLCLAEEMCQAEGAPWRHDEGPRDGKRVNGSTGVDKRRRGS